MNVSLDQINFPSCKAQHNVNHINSHNVYCKLLHSSQREVLKYCKIIFHSITMFDFHSIHVCLKKQVYITSSNPKKGKHCSQQFSMDFHCYCSFSVFCVVVIIVHGSLFCLISQLKITYIGFLFSYFFFAFSISFPFKLKSVSRYFLILKNYSTKIKYNKLAYSNVDDVINRA